MRSLKWARGKIRKSLGFIAQFSFFQHAHFFTNVQFAQIVQFNGTEKYSTNGNGTGKCRAERMVLRNAPRTRMVLRNAGNSCGPGAQNNVIRLRWSPRRDIRSVCGAFDRLTARYVFSTFGFFFDIWGGFFTSLFSQLSTNRRKICRYALSGTMGNATLHVNRVNINFPSS